MVEGIIGFSEMLSIAQTIGIVGTMVLTLLFSRKQLQSLSIHDQTRVLNDLDEKVRKMAEIIIEKPSMQKVIYKLEKPSEELAFGYYILFICSHAYSMRQKNVLNDEEWTGWLHWMKNCFKYGTIGEQWEQIQLERWLNPAFENFVNSVCVLIQSYSPKLTTITNMKCLYMLSREEPLSNYCTVHTKDSRYSTIRTT